ncbi:Npun_F0296 family exosortase-dependent surface protein [Comamonas odontotermitis]|uniref:Npun_F0296 family exosortase-dependent surface protein n=1 Tax=Comamonas odontotermitis TaxID=379895 RepID=UPI001CC608B5|nr:Ig-like domain-containing protein [Comamonas odontotermitis]UBB18760.1 hypothetical protein LAD35_09100 [Comamonas odontotermitis]
MLRLDFHLRRALSIASLAGFSACSVQASQLTLYLSQPSLNAARNAAVPDGALPWSSTYGQNYAIETFNNETPGAKTSGAWAIGTYAVAPGGNTDVSRANQYGGAGTDTALGRGGSHFLNAGNAGSPAGVTITLTKPARYVGFWWSAGSNGNNVELLDEHDNVLTSMTTNDLMRFLNDPANTTMKALNGKTTYTRTQYNGNPFFGPPANAGEPYVYLNYVLNDTTGFGTTVIRKIRFWGSGFELDNVAVREEALPGLPAETELPDSWVPTEITKDFVDPPVTANDAGATRINTASGPLDLTANDPFVPAGSSVTPQPSSANGGTVAPHPDYPGQFLYTPAPGFHGVDTFSYQVCLPSPNQSKCATSTVTMTVTAPDLVVDLTDIKPTATVGVPYEGSFTCTNHGTADALTGTRCTTGPLPGGLAVGICTMSPAGTVWHAGDAIPKDAVVTCAVTGTPTNDKGVTTTIGTTDTDGDSNPGNNSASKQITVEGAPDLVIDLEGLPPTGVIDRPYQGSYTCRNQGSADIAGAECTATGLPPGVSQGPQACTMVTPSGRGAVSWTSPADIPEGAVVTCIVEGTPTQQGPSTTNGTAGNSTATKDITISAMPVPTEVPSLTGWITLVLSAMMAALGLRSIRRHQR